MTNRLMKDNRYLYLIPCLISLLFFVVRIVGCYTLPWVDEVMLTDPAVNFILYGKWASTSNNIGFSLGLLLLVPWLYVFGISHIAVCAFSAFWAFLSSLVILYLLNKKRIVTSLFGQICVICLFWGAHEMGFMTTNGRHDTLVMFLTTLLIVVLLKTSTIEWKNLLAVFCTSFFLFWAGVTSLPFVLFALLIFFISGAYDRKLIFVQGCCIVAGIICSWLMNAGLYYSIGRYGYYKHLFFSFSATVNGKEQLSFFERLWNSYYVNLEAFILCFANLILYVAINSFKNSFNRRNISYFLAYLCIPLSMCIAGRYPIYYTWSFWVSGVIMFVWLICQCDLKFQTYILASLSVVFTVYGLYPVVLKDYKAYNRMSTFIKQQEFKKDDVIIAHYAPYFEIVKNYTNSYFCAEYWMEMPERIDYVVICPMQFGAYSLYDINKNLQQQGKDVVLQSEMDDGSLQVYKVVQ